MGPQFESLAVPLFHSLRVGHQDFSPAYTLTISSKTMRTPMKVVTMRLTELLHFLLQFRKSHLKLKQPSVFIHRSIDNVGLRTWSNPS